MEDHGAGIPLDDAPRHVPCEVDVPGFSGPLELLLHLIRKHKLDILDIPMSFVTEKYLEYLDTMLVLNLDVAAEYLEMAATLVRIKSRMLLPAGADEPEAQPGEEPEDPRAELVKRLLEYQRYRDAADRLLERDILQRDVFLRARPEPKDDADRPLDEVGIGALLDAFAVLARRAQVDIAHQVTIERVSVAQRIQELVDLLRERKRIVFERLFDGQPSRVDIVVTLLALLEMTRLHMTRLLQADADGPLYVDFIGDAAEPEEEAGGTGGKEKPP